MLLFLGKGIHRIEYFVQRYRVVLKGSFIKYYLDNINERFVVADTLMKQCIILPYALIVI